MVYSINEIREILYPIAMKYNLYEAYIFGSYATGKAVEDSDIDILIDRKDSDIQNIFDLSGFYLDCKEALSKDVDIVTMQSLMQPDTKKVCELMIKNIMKERVKIFEREGLSDNSSEFISESKEIPWRNIKGLRDVVAHGYNSLDKEIIWNIAENEINKLNEYCCKKIQEYVE